MINIKQHASTSSIVITILLKRQTDDREDKKLIMDVEEQPEPQKEDGPVDVDKEEYNHAGDDDDDDDDDDDIDDDVDNPEKEDDDDEMVQEISTQPSQEEEEDNNNNNNPDNSNDGNDVESPSPVLGRVYNNCGENIDDEEEEKLRKEREAQQLRISLWKAALEIFIHQILHVRRVYHKDSFCSTRFLGVQCHANRHPKVVSYIGNSLKVIIPAILSEGMSTEMVVEIYDQVKMYTYERYSLTFKSKKKKKLQQQQQQQQQSSPDNDNDQSTDLLISTSYDIKEIESELRDLICSIGSLARNPPPYYWPNSVSFKILLLQKSGSDANAAMTVVGNALAEAKWYKSNINTEKLGGEKKRLIYDVPYCGCKFHYTILRQPIQRKRKVRIKLPLPTKK